MSQFYQQNKKWFLFGTLLYILSFSLSGTQVSSQTQGMVTLGSEEPAEKPTEKAELYVETEDAKPEGEKPVSGPVKSPSNGGQVDTPADVELNTKETAADSKTAIPQVSQTVNSMQLYSVTLSNGKVIEYSIEKDKDGYFFVKHFPKEKTEGGVCSFCNGSGDFGILELKINADTLQKIENEIKRRYGDTDEVSKSKEKIRPKANEDDNTEKVSTSKQYDDLKKLLDDCTNITCKVDKYSNYLNKANKRDKKKKSNLELTEDDALELFQSYIQDEIGELLTFNPDSESFSAYDEYLSSSSGIYGNLGFGKTRSQLLLENYRTSGKFNNNILKASSLIQKLISKVDGQYKNVKSELKKLSIDKEKAQLEKTISSHIRLNDSIRTGDVRSAQIDSDDLLLNNSLLLNLDRSLFPSLRDGFYDSRGTDGDVFYNLMRDDINISQAQICRTYYQATGNSVANCGNGINNFDSLVRVRNANASGVSNITRGGRGILNGSSNGNFEIGNGIYPTNEGVRIITNGNFDTLNNSGNPGTNIPNTGTRGRRGIPAIRGN